MREKKFLVLDWDGTAFNSIEQGFRRVDYALSCLNLPPIDYNILRQNMGMKVTELTSLILNHCGADKSFIDKFEHFFHELEEAPHRNYELEKVLFALKDFGYLIGLLTSRTNESWLKSCQAIDFNYKVFDFVQTATHYYHYKPSGRVFGPIINWSKKEGRGSEDILYFGDTINFDLKAARDSDPPIDFVGVVSGVNTKEEFIAAGVAPEMIVESFDLLPNFLHHMIKNKVEI